MKHFYEDVPRLGNVAVSRHAQAQMIEAGISQEAFDRVLLEPTRPDIPDGRTFYGVSATGCASSSLPTRRRTEGRSSLRRFTAYRHKHGQRTPDNEEADTGLS